MMLAASLWISLVVGTQSPAASPEVVRPPAAPAKEPGAAPRVARESMARSYLAVDRAYRTALEAGRLDAERRAAVNRRFDSVTMLFFSGRFDQALPPLHEVTASLSSADPAVAARIRRALDTIVTFEPRVLTDPARAVALRRQALGGEALKPGDAAWALVGPTGVRWPLAALPETLTLRALAGAETPPAMGRYELLVRPTGSDTEFVASSFELLPESPEATALQLRERVAALEAAGTGSERDRAALASRIGLLKSEPSVAKSAQFLARQEPLARELSMEVAALEAGRSPWSGFRGDTWRTIRAVALDVPCRVVVPASIPADVHPPLVIALHGAGGDESMFPDGYGAGLLAELAERRGFVVVAPSTTTFAATPVVFDAIVEAMRESVGIDPNRVFVIGHSMGAMATSKIAELRAEAIAGIAMCAGGGEPKPRGEKRPPPMALVAGALDPLFPIERLRAAAAAAERSYGERSIPFLFREFPDDGHTLVVTAALPEVIDWLLALPPRATAPASTGAPQAPQPAP